MNFPVGSSFPYAASALLSCAVWRERGVSLDVFSLAEATNAVRCGVDNLSLPPTDDISSWSAPRLKGIRGRFAQRWHMDRAPLAWCLSCSRTVRPRTDSSSRAGSRE